MDRPNFHTLDSLHILIAFSWFSNGIYCLCLIAWKYGARAKQHNETYFSNRVSSVFGILNEILNNYCMTKLKAAIKCARVVAHSFRKKNSIGFFFRFFRSRTFAMFCLFWLSNQRHVVGFGFSHARISNRGRECIFVCFCFLVWCMLVIRFLHTHCPTGCRLESVQSNMMIIKSSLFKRFSHIFVSFPPSKRATVPYSIYLSYALLNMRI